MNFELNDYRFRQADVLRLVPGLSQGTLQNWIARGLLQLSAPKPHKHAKTSWCAYNVIALRFVVQVTQLGLKPSEALKLAERLEDEIEGFLERFTPRPNEETGIEEFRIEGDRLEDYQSMLIMKDDNGAPYMVRQEANREEHKLLNFMLYRQIAYITFESDLHFTMSLNAISRYVAGRDPETGTKIMGNERILSQAETTRLVATKLADAIRPKNEGGDE